MLYSVDEYIRAGLSHFIVDPDENLLYTERKHRHIGRQQTEVENTEKDADGIETALLHRIKFPESE